MKKTINHIGQLIILTLIVTYITGYAFGYFLHH